jgi:hypothetical protein
MSLLSDECRIVSQEFPENALGGTNTDLAGASDHRNSIREADRAVQQLD